MHASCAPRSPESALTAAGTQLLIGIRSVPGLGETGIPFCLTLFGSWVWRASSKHSDNEEY